MHTGLTPTKMYDAEGREIVFDTTDPTLEVTALTDADATLTIAQLRRGILTITPTANRTLTLPTPALIVAGLPGCVVGSVAKFTIKNLTASTYTAILAVVTSLTNGGVAGDLTTAAAATSTYALLVTSATPGSETVVLYKL